MGVEAEPVTRVEEDRILVDLQGPDMGIVIGRRGETLDALQYLTSLVVNREEQNLSLIHISGSTTGLSSIPRPTPTPASPYWTCLLYTSRCV